MEVRGVLAFLAVAVSVVYATTDVTFPEIVNERIGSRIVSGWEAEVGQFPFQLSLRMVSPLGAVSSCGGTIISEDWGLTAAHCTAGRLTMVLRAGVVNLTLPQFIFETTKYYNHPLYDNNRPSLVQPHDIGLLEFGRSLVFGDLVQPIRLQRSWTKNANYDRVRLTASGWGRTWTDASAPENLNWVYLLGDTQERCFAQYGAGGIVTDSTICASYYNVTSQSTCSGDSGGPLTVIDDDGAITQVGVTSFVSGTGCHTPLPAGFIRPGHYHDWFFEVTGINFDWSLESDTTTEAATTEAATTEAATTEAATTEAATTEAATTEAATTEADSEESDSSSSEESDSSSSSSSEEEEED